MMAAPPLGFQIECCTKLHFGLVGFKEPWFLSRFWKLNGELSTFSKSSGALGSLEPPLMEALDGQVSHLKRSFLWWIDKSCIPSSILLWNSLQKMLEKKSFSQLELIWKNYSIFWFIFIILHLVSELNFFFLFGFKYYNTKMKTKLKILSLL